MNVCPVCNRTINDGDVHYTDLSRYAGPLCTYVAARDLNPNTTHQVHQARYGKGDTSGWNRKPYRRRAA